MHNTLMIDPDVEYIVRCGTEEIVLTPNEWDLIIFLMKNEGRIISQWSLIDVLGGDQSAEAIRLYVHRLRVKLGDNTKSPKIITTHRGRGYRLMRQS